MRSAKSLLMLLCALVALSFGQNSTPAKSNATAAASDTDAIRQIEDDGLKGEETTDVAALERVLADDYVNLTPRGLGPTKAEILEHLRPRAGQAPPIR